MKEMKELDSGSYGDLIAAYETQAGSSFKESLTGLFNNAFFQISLAREVERSNRYGDPFVVALIDVDGFAQYNKRNDPIKGDLLLKEISGIVSHTVRQVDVAARYSGDRIGLILIKSGAESALFPLDRIRKTVEQLQGGHITVSIGCAVFPADGTDGFSLIGSAEKALAMAKSRGKNRIQFIEKRSDLYQDQKPKILIVDDEPLNRKLLEAVLSPLGNEILNAANGEEALAIAQKVDLGLILLDIMMPGIDGYEVCRRLKGNDKTRLVPVVMVTALDAAESKIMSIEAGADDFITKPPNRHELIARTKSLLRVRALNSSLAAIEDVLISFANAVEAKDTYTQGHIQRVATLALSLGQRMGLSGSEMKAIWIGGILHDIGKIAVPREILNKPGPLDAQEWELMKNHCEAGYRICLPLKQNLGAALEVIRHHHEKLDGSGYPDGLKGTEISAAARLMAVVDIYDALITDRAYRKAMKREEAFKILFSESEGGKLDGRVVECLANMVGNVKADQTTDQHSHNK